MEEEKNDKIVANPCAWNQCQSPHAEKTFSFSFGMGKRLKGCCHQQEKSHFAKRPNTDYYIVSHGPNCC